MEVATKFSPRQPSCKEHRLELTSYSRHEPGMRSLTSMSKRKPRKEARTGGAEKAIIDFGNVVEGLSVVVVQGRAMQ